MNVVLFTHPAFLGSQSHTHMARLFAQSFQARGHSAEVRQPRAVLRQHLSSGPLAKWAGYVDQYLIFPAELRRRLRDDPPDTVYAFCDQALGPWVPLVASRAHVVHCNDLLALRSALGLIPENPTGLMGRLYQRWIRKGFRRARHFISISEKTRDDLHRYGQVEPELSEVVYLGLNQRYERMAPDAARSVLTAAGLDLPADGFLLHVGGGQWYKNTVGVLEMYDAYARQREASGLPVLALMMVSRPLAPEVERRVQGLPASARVHLASGVSSDALVALYSSASALLFPSLAEGWGWPVAEGLACGCPVLTTDEAPMTEAGGPHAHYLPRRGGDAASLRRWAEAGGRRIAELQDRPAAHADAARAAGMAWARARYDPQRAVDRYLEIYERALQSARVPQHRPGKALA